MFAVPFVFYLCVYDGCLSRFSLQRETNVEAGYACCALVRVMTELAGALLRGHGVMIRTRNVSRQAKAENGKNVEAKKEGATRGGMSSCVPHPLIETRDTQEF